MFATTKETAKILGVSPRRVHHLLTHNRIEGAFKLGNQWVIPLCDGKPIISEGKRGPKASWHDKAKKPLKKDLAVVKVVRQNIDGNADHQTNKTVISVQRGRERVMQGHGIDIHGPSRMFYSHEVREDKGGVRVWLETYFDVDVFIDEDWQPPVEQEESVSQVRALNSSKTL